MIGVIADHSDRDVVAEFFELFKTPWEFYRSGRSYDAVLSTKDVDVQNRQTEVLIVYASRLLAFDAEQRIETGSRCHNQALRYGDDYLPVYGASITFPKEYGPVALTGLHSSVTYSRKLPMTAVVRVGYDIFAEIRLLLTQGQPPENAHVPTLELHTAILRDLLITFGVSFVEIPAVPFGYQFIACLTHDVDHPYVSRHKFDHTILGFLYRSTLGSLFKLLRQRISLHHAFMNWKAACLLPLVHLRIAKDFWASFPRYMDIEKPECSTFFVIPFQGRAGSQGRYPAPKMRAASYGTGDIADQINTLISGGCEVGVHGIDAWLDTASASEEFDEVCRITGQQKTGIRMHWLYFAEDSFVALDQAGAEYDSTIGYNETVGYRAGTTQAFKPLSAERLIELPLHIMDTALFFPSHLGLSVAAARRLVDDIIVNAVRHGGVVTINWHDRSIAPERLWEDFYSELLAELRKRGAWFATAAQTVTWFRKRRAAVFEESSSQWCTVESETPDELPGLQLVVHKTEQQRPAFNWSVRLATPA